MILHSMAGLQGHPDIMRFQSLALSLEPCESRNAHNRVGDTLTRASRLALPCTLVFSICFLFFFLYMNFVQIKKLDVSRFVCLSVCLGVVVGVFVSVCVCACVFVCVYYLDNKELITVVACREAMWMFRRRSYPWRCSWHVFAAIKASIRSRDPRLARIVCPHLSAVELPCTSVYFTGICNSKNKIKQKCGL